MITITFLPKKHSPNAKPAIYHVNQWDHVLAEEIATKVFKEEYGIKVNYYDRVMIAETRILQ